MPPPRFKTVDTFVFDLDYTLYSAQCGLMDDMMVNIIDYLKRHFDLAHDDAVTYRAELSKAYGSSLGGLVQKHGIDPLPFLEHVHDVDYNKVTACMDLKTALESLQGRKIIYTNAPKFHSDKMLKHLRLDHVFSERFTIEDTSYVPKPARESFDHFLKKTAPTPSKTAMFEDTAKNLKTAHDIGFQTVWISYGSPVAKEYESCIHSHAETLGEWIDRYNVFLNGNNHDT